MPSGDPSGLLLPPHARLFHIGPPKSGTTALQWALAARRAELLELGVRYPGRSVNHRMAVAAAMGRTVGWSKQADGVRSAPDPRLWNSLVAEVRGDPERRVLLGHEHAASARPEQIRRMVRDLGEGVHVVITMRSFSLVLPSLWQESNKAAGNTGSFEGWLRRALNTDSATGRAIAHRHHVGGLVQRWGEAVGLERVRVVITDEREPGRIFSAFERFLGLPEDFLAEVPRPPYAANRSLTLPEAELARRLNVVLRGTDLSWEEFNRHVVRGGFRRMLGHRRPEPDEARLGLPEWAAEQVAEQSRRDVESLLSSGVVVVGDPAALTRPPRLATAAESHDQVRLVPIDAAVEAIAGVVALATGHDSEFVRRPAPDPVRPVVVRALREEPASALLQELRRRLNRRVRVRLAGLRPGSSRPGSGAPSTAASPSAPGTVTPSGT